MKTIKDSVEDALIEKFNIISEETGINHREYYLYIIPELYEEFEAFIEGYYIPSDDSNREFTQGIHRMRWWGFDITIKVGDVYNEQGFNILEKGLK